MVTVTHRPAEAHRLAVIGLATLLVLHGVAHFAGLVDSLDKADARRPVDYLGGAWTVSDPSWLRAFGVLWVGVGSLVVLAAVAVLLRHHRARAVVAVVTLLSLMLSVVGLWSAAVGVGVNLVLLALVAFVPERVGLRGPS